MLQMNIYEEFTAWLDDILENNDMPESTEAFCFNLYEESAEEHIYSIQLVATAALDPADNGGDWACDEAWSSDENVFTVDISDEEQKDREHAHELFEEMVKEYAENGRYGKVLLKAKGLALGFVDGDLDIIYKAE